jgi:hypothetical protein
MSTLPPRSPSVVVLSTGCTTSLPNVAHEHPDTDTRAKLNVRIETHGFPPTDAEIDRRYTEHRDALGIVRDGEDDTDPTPPAGCVALRPPPAPVPRPTPPGAARARPCRSPTAPRGRRPCRRTSPRKRCAARRALSGCASGRPASPGCGATCSIRRPPNGHGCARAYRRQLGGAAGPRGHQPPATRHADHACSGHEFGAGQRLGPPRSEWRGRRIAAHACAGRDLSRSSDSARCM